MSERRERDRPYDGSEVAVVGMAGRFPGAPDVAAFWSNLAAGVESIRFFSDEELLEAGVEKELVESPDYVKARPVLDGDDLFDAAFFGLTPREASILDPQHRVFLELAWQGLESAGYDPERYEGVVSVFAGASFSNYLVHNLYENRPVMESFGDLESTIYNVPDSLATLVGYKLNFRGLCCAVQTFCSTSLVATHLAIQNLLSFECDMALAGGVTINVPQTSGYLYADGSIVSPDGRCRAFAAGANGTVFGNGAGVVVLKRLEDALSDGDRVHAVLLGSAVNNDGALKLSYAAPGMKGQTEVVVEALAASGVSPESIELLEAHGTGTALGDPVEVAALTKAFRTRTEKAQYCALGSVKTNVGHLDAAAGVTGLIKAILAIEHGQIPPSLHFERPNPEIDFERSPFFVPTELRPFRGEGPRRAGVSAFGIGGTNAHVVLEEAPARDVEPTRRPQLLVLSAKTSRALEAMSRNLARHLREHPEIDLGDAALTLQVGRSGFAHRLSVVASNPQEAAEALERSAPEGLAVTEPPRVALVVEGTGLDGEAVKDLLSHAPTFRSELERAGAWLAREGKDDLRRLVDEEPRSRLAALSVEHALGAQMIAWTGRPQAVAGSLAAAVLAGVLELEDALRLASEGSLDPSRLHAPEIPILCSRSGNELSSAEAISPERWLEMPSVEPRTVEGYVAVELGSRVEGYESALEMLGKLWVAGVEVDWTRVHEGERRYRVVLPTYPFERERHWVEPEDDSKAPLAKRADLATWFYHPQWRSSLAAPTPESEIERYVVFADASGVGDAVAERLSSRGREVVTVRGHEVLVESIGASRASLLYFASIDEGVERGFYRLLESIRSLSGRGEGAPLVRVVTAGACDVTGKEGLRPEAAMTAALAKVASQEQEHLRVSVVDLDPDELTGGARPSLLDPLTRELERVGGDPLVAFRGGRRWTPSYESVPLENVYGAPALLRKRGAYVVTGGLGEVGFVLAAYLAKRARARLALVGRTKLPPREEWDRTLAEASGPASPAAAKIRKVLALEGMGAEVLVLHADVADEVEMRSALDAATERFGEIHGVIHAAGYLAPDGFALVEHLGREACERQFAPKVEGVRVLERLFRGRALDFWFLTSSLSVVLGGLGYAAYAAANAFLDVFAAARNREGTPVWKVVDWDQFRFATDEARRGSSAQSLEELAMTPMEGVATFEQMLRMDHPSRVVISTAALPERHARLEGFLGSVDGPGTERREGARGQARPSVGTEYVAPRNEVEEKIARIWQELLGIDRVGAHDDFFALGGHSLFAARVLSRIKERLSVSLPLGAVFEKPTVAELAAHVQAVRWAARGGAKSSGEEKAERVEVEL